MTAPSVEHLVWVVVPTPAYAVLDELLCYRSAQPVPPGTLVRVPLGRRVLLGVVWDTPEAAQAPAPERLRDVGGVLADVPALSAHWRSLVRFAARYYQRSLGEVALTSLPPQLRTLDLQQVARRLRPRGRPDSADPGSLDDTKNRALTAEQACALTDFEAQVQGVSLLVGSTGSGKTEVYLRAAATALSADPCAQVLVLVPEINLTPQLQARLLARFAPDWGPQAVVALHSGMTPAQRLRAWLAAHSGMARLVLGTRLAVLASMPCLRLIVVDEEHDPSYKSHEGARYSARDLAVWRAHQLGIRVLLGSATPSLESWWASRPAGEGGRYRRLTMPSRVGAAPLPTVRLIDMDQQPRGCVLAPFLVAEIAQRVQRGEQALLLLNRRGYAPVLRCPDCDWKSTCPHCSAYRVFHKADRSLRCHHCGWADPVPRACPECGNLDIQPVGRGTEQLQEQVVHLLADVRRSDGSALRVLRIDADTTRAQGSLQAQLQAVHDGDVDVLVGTQMLAKGHDFRRISLVAAVNPDGALFSADFRAPERLFALLMQAAGRAGRDATLGASSLMVVQTQHPRHPLYAALVRDDYPAFASSQLDERRAAGLPPFMAQALLRAEAHTASAALSFLKLAMQSAQASEATLPWINRVTFYSPVPMTVARVADVDRAQLLIESPSRADLQRLLAAWGPLLHPLRHAQACRGLLRWAFDVDPLTI